MSTNRPRLDFDAIAQAANGQWLSTIFPAVGIALKSPANKHQSCPICGGRDRFRCDNKKGDGTWICNQCGAGSGFSLVMQYTNNDAYDTNAAIASALGLDATVTITDSQRDEWRNKQIEVEAKEKEAKRQARLDAATKAVNIWDTAIPADDNHPYIVKKGISAFNIKQDNTGNLIVPMHYHNVTNNNTTLVNVQTIDKDGGKKFLYGGLVSGAYCIIGASSAFKLTNVILICEGYATGATVFVGANYAYPVIVAFNAGNLEHVSKSIRAQYPDHRIIICADDDSDTAIKLRDRDIAKGNTPKPMLEYNAGIYKAQQAASLVGGEVVYPKFNINSEVAA